MSSDERYFAFIRAINTGGRRLTNEQLVAPFMALGYSDVGAYQAAGNVTFRPGDRDRNLERQLEGALREAYGFESPVFVRSRRELAAICDDQPFSDEEIARTEGRIQVSFLRSTPAPEVVAGVLALVPPGERVAFSSREWFWLPARGVSDSQLPVSTIERLVGTTTMRTLGTLSRMLEKFG